MMHRNITAIKTWRLRGGIEFGQGKAGTTVCLSRSLLKIMIIRVDTPELLL